MATKQDDGTTRPVVREMREVDPGFVNNVRRTDSTPISNDGVGVHQPAILSSPRDKTHDDDDQKMDMKTLFRSSLSNLKPRRPTTTTSSKKNNENRKHGYGHARSESDDLAQIPDLARSRSGRQSSRQRTSLGEEADTPGTEDGLFGERGFEEQAGRGGVVVVNEGDGKRVLRKIDRVSFRAGSREVVVVVGGCEADKAVLVHRAASILLSIPLNFVLDLSLSRHPTNHLPSTSRSSCHS